jgi:5-methylcytosine-specific restriction endonuclease McrA
LEVLEAFEGVCALCGSSEYLQIDHIVPLCDGGENAASNLRPLCRDCHGDKCAYERMGAVRRQEIYGANNPFLPQKGV